jgi:hypothetical protein
MYMTDRKINVLKKLEHATQSYFGILTTEERLILSSIISLYEKPKRN